MLKHHLHTHTRARALTTYTRDVTQFITCGRTSSKKRENDVLPNDRTFVDDLLSLSKQANMRPQ
jgi:hypothetical protein